MRKITKWILAALLLLISAASILYIFFIYEPHNYTYKSPTADKPTADASINFETDPLVYDGSETLSYMSGVSVHSDDGTDLSDRVSVTVKSGSRLNSKILIYTVTDLNGFVTTKERKLTLKNYNGPSVTIDDKLPALKQNQLEQINAYKQSIHAEDGYGNDISDRISLSAQPSPSGAGYFTITASVQNQFMDVYSKSQTIKATLTEPIIVLKDESVLLDKGASFDPKNHILYAVDQNNRDISSSVVSEGTVDTNKEGSYTIMYRYTDANEQTTSALLKVIVQ